MKLLKKILLLLMAGILLYSGIYAWQAFPIISGYGAKILCSCTMVAGREAPDVIAQELGRFPISLSTFTVHYEDSSVTASVFGLARKKAVYRKGLGCTLINEASEEEVRNQTPLLTRLPIILQDTIPWPSGDLLKDTAFSHVNYKKLKYVLEEAFSEPSPEKLRRTRAVVIVYDGHIIAERYAEGFNKNSRLIGWSMTKSLTNAIVGVLVKKQKLNLYEPVAIDAWKKDARSKITLHHLLQASSGLEWEENYSGPSGATNMLFKEKNMGLYAAASPAEYEPGKFFEYSSGTTNLISWIIRQNVGDSCYYKIPYDEIFHKTGMYSIIIEPDAGGTFVGSSYSFGTARDWARFGLLYLNNGIWNGEQILPEGWVKYTTTPAPAAPQGKYGAQFWLNAGDPKNMADRVYPNVPPDMYWADGYEGQNVFIIPSKKLVVVKLSLSHGDHLDDNKFLSEIISCVQ